MSFARAFSVEVASLLIAVLLTWVMSSEIPSLLGTSNSLLLMSLSPFIATLSEALIERKLLFLILLRSPLTISLESLETSLFLLTSMDFITSDTLLSLNSIGSKESLLEVDSSGILSTSFNFFFCQGLENSRYSEYWLIVH